MAASFCLPRVTADGGGRYAPPPTPRAGGKRGGSGVTREGRRLLGNDNAARIRNVDAPPTPWPLNNGAAFRAVLRTAPDDSKAEPSCHHGDAWQTSAPSLHCHLRRRFPRRCSTLPRVPRRSHEAAPRASMRGTLTIISLMGNHASSMARPDGLSHKRNYRPPCSIRHAQQATTASAALTARRGRPAQKPRADRPRLLLTFRLSVRVRLRAPGGHPWPPRFCVSAPSPALPAYRKNGTRQG